MNQSSTTAQKARSPLETVFLARQLRLDQENVLPTCAAGNAAAASTSSGIAVDNLQEQLTPRRTNDDDSNDDDGIDATVIRSKTSETWTSGLQIHPPPPRPTRKSSSDRHHMHAGATVHGRSVHHLAWARDFFGNVDDESDNDSNDSDSPTCTRISSGSQKANIKAFNGLLVGALLRLYPSMNTSLSPDNRQEAKTFSLGM